MDNSVLEHPTIRSILKRRVKVGRSYEIRRLLRRAKRLQIKSGNEVQKAKNERKAKRILSIIEALNLFTPDELVTKVSKLIMQARNDGQSFEDYISSRSTDGLLNEEWFITLISSKPLLSFICRLFTASTVEEISQSKKGVTRTHSRRQRIKKKQSKPKKRNIESGGQSNDNEDSEKLVEIHNEEIDPPNNPSVVVDDFFLSNNAMDNFTIKLTEHTTPQVSTNPELSEGKRKRTAKSKALESTFSSSMMDTTEESHGRIRKKNRMGQRSRQKLWTNKYGENAKHLSFLSSGTLQKSTQLRNRKRRSGLDSAEYGSNTKLKEEIHLNEPKNKREVLHHPSWEAKKKQKESQKIQEFQGTKITFDD